MLNKESILTAISSMTILELCDLIKMMEKKFDISVSNLNLSSISTAAKETSDVVISEKKTYNVVVSNVGVNKIALIKLVRSLTNLGLKESKDTVEKLPFVIKESLSEEEAQKLVKQIEQIGAKATLQ